MSFFNKWSSARGHIQRGTDPVLSDDCYIEEGIKDWLGYLMEREDEGLTEAIRQNTRTGRPCGDKGFIKTIEGLLGRRLKALPRGRPCRGK